jgi:hypothetical protein
VSNITVREPTSSEIIDWWRWLLTIPASQTPLQGGQNVRRNNPRSLWECACTGGMDRPGGRDPNPRELPINDFQRGILIPVLTTAHCKEELGSGATDNDAREQARAKVYPPNELKCIVNSTYNITPVVDSLIEVGPFTVDVPADNILDGPNSNRQNQQPGLRFFAAGYFVKIFLPPPGQAGRHTINFGGRKGGFSTEVIYHIIQA